MAYLVRGAASTMPSAWIATLTPMLEPDPPWLCMRRLSRCIERLGAKPMSAAEAMKATIAAPLVDRTSAAGARTAAPGRALRGALKRGRNASHGGDAASSILGWLAAAFMTLVPPDRPPLPASRACQRYLISRAPYGVAGGAATFRLRGLLFVTVTLALP